MTIWQLAFVFIALAVCALIFYLYLFHRAFVYLDVDLLAYFTAKDHKRKKELIAEKLIQRVGLAIWRIHNNLRIFPADDLDTQVSLERINNLSAEILQVNWESMQGDEPIRLSGKVKLYIPSPKTRQEKEAVRIIEAAFKELGELQEVSKILLIGDLFQMNMEFRFTQK